MIRMISALAAVMFAAAPAMAVTQSWNGYRWARTGPLQITVGDNLSATWKPYLAPTTAGWSADPVIDLVTVRGQTVAQTCRPVFGGIQICSGNYGANGWLGYTNVWLGGGFLVQATIRLNDHYFGMAKYNTSAWRQATMCHELGHSIGLAHGDMSRTNANNGSCLDATNDPSGLAGGANGTLANTGPGATDFAALAGIYARLDATQLGSTRPQYRTGAGLYIDGIDREVALTAVPEPHSWALFILGFGGIGVVMRRSRLLPVRAC